MAVAKDYLLSFDFSEFDNQINELTRDYTDFGMAVREVVNAATTDTQALRQSTEGVSASLQTMIPQLDQSAQSIQRGMGSTVRNLENLSRQSETVAANMSRLSGIQVGGEAGVGTPPELQRVSKEIKAVLEMADVARATMSEVEQQHKEMKRTLKDELEVFKKGVAQLLQYAESELKGLKQSLGSLLSNIPGVGGGVIGTLINWMILGRKEDARLTAQRGEMADVLEATGERLSGPGSLEKTIGWFSAFQEHAQWFYGISKEETQGVVSQMAQAGYRREDFEKRISEDLGYVGQNAVVATMALDAHLHRAQGTAMSNVITLVSDYGDTLEKATKDYIGFGMAAQRSGAGIDKFINAVMSGASAMQQYGIDVRDVANIMVNIERHYRRMGLHPQHAGEMAARFVDNYTGAVANLGSSSKLELARRMFPGMEAHAAFVKYEEGAARAARGEDEGFLVEATMHLTAWALEGRGRSEAILFLENQGMQTQTAATLLDAREELKKYNDFQKLAPEQKRAVQQAFEINRKAVSTLEQTERKLINALAGVGNGLLKVLTSILAILTVGITSLPRLISATLRGGEEGNRELTKIGDEMKMLVGTLGEGVVQAMEGLEEVPGSVSEALGGPLDILKRAASGNLEGPRREDQPTTPRVVGRGTSGSPIELFKGAWRAAKGLATGAAGTVGKRIPESATPEPPAVAPPDSATEESEPPPKHPGMPRGSEVKAVRDQERAKPEPLANAKEREIMANPRRAEVVISSEAIAQADIKHKERTLPPSD